MPVSLTYEDLVRLIRVSAAIALVAAVCMIGWRWTELQAQPIKVLWQVSLSALGVPPLFVLVFAKVSWQRQWLARAMGRRMVHGLWWGELHTEFKPSAQADAMSPIPIAFVVKQTYFTLSIQSYTANQPAHSTLETLTVDPRNARAQLKYVFEMQRLHLGEDKITTGYGDLRLTSGDQRLEGYYWTNASTRGFVSLGLVARDCNAIDSFADAQRVKQERDKGAVSAPTAANQV